MFYISDIKASRYQVYSKEKALKKISNLYLNWLYTRMPQHNFFMELQSPRTVPLWKTRCKNRGTVSWTTKTYIFTPLRYLQAPNIYNLKHVFVRFIVVGRDQCFQSFHTNFIDVLFKANTLLLIWQM